MFTDCSSFCLCSNVQYKIWVKASAEQQFLYGNHILKSGIGRMTENIEKYQGVVIYSMNDLPLVNNVFFTLMRVSNSDPLQMYADVIHFVELCLELKLC